VESVSCRAPRSSSPLPIEVGPAELLGLVKPLGSIDENDLDSEQLFESGDSRSQTVGHRMGLESFDGPYSVSPFGLTLKRRL